MKLIGSLCVAIPCLVWAQQAPSSGAATTSGTCSLANTGQIGTVKYTCGIGARQGAELLKVLNKILANAFEEMIKFNNSKQYKDLLQECLSQTQSTPEWLTPRLLCGLAYLGLGDRDRAQAMLSEFDSRTGPAYDTDGCKQMSDYLHSRLH
jgi:hypothetical protein